MQYTDRNALGWFEMLAWKRTLFVYVPTFYNTRRAGYVVVVVVVIDDDVGVGVGVGVDAVGVAVAVVVVVVLVVCAENSRQ